MCRRDSRPNPCSGVIFPKIDRLPIYRDLSEKKVPISYDFAAKTHQIPRKILKIRPIVRDFFMKIGTHVLGFLAQSQLKILAHTRIS